MTGIQPDALLADDLLFDAACDEAEKIDNLRALSVEIAHAQMRIAAVAIGMKDRDLPKQVAIKRGPGNGAQPIRRIGALEFARGFSRGGR